MDLFPQLQRLQAENDELRYKNLKQIEALAKAITLETHRGWGKETQEQAANRIIGCYASLTNHICEANEMMPDLSKCPKCGGPADNGHSRGLPPSAYYCTKCENGWGKDQNPMYASLDAHADGAGCEELGSTVPLSDYERDMAIKDQRIAELEAELDLIRSMLHPEERTWTKVSDGVRIAMKAARMDYERIVELETSVANWKHRSNTEWERAEHANARYTQHSIIEADLRAKLQEAEAKLAERDRQFKDSCLWESTVVWSDQKMPDGSPTKMAAVPKWAIHKIECDSNKKLQDELTTLRAQVAAIEAAKAGEPEMPKWDINSTEYTRHLNTLSGWGRQGWDAAAAWKVKFENEDKLNQIIAGHRDDYKREAAALCVELKEAESPNTVYLRADPKTLEQARSQERERIMKAAERFRQGSEFIPMLSLEDLRRAVEEEI